MRTEAINHYNTKRSIDSQKISKDEEDIVKKEKGKSSDRERGETYFDRIVDAESKKFADIHGIFPPQNPVAKYINTLAQKIIGDSNIDVSVCSHWNNINATAFPNNKIFISFPLIQFCDTEEELLFVLHHELIHITSQHAKKSFQESREGEQGMLKRYLKKSGTARLNEYQADGGSFIQLDQKGINSFGGILFSKKLMERERNAECDVAHGKQIDRFINLLWGTRLYDLECLSEKELTSIPSEIKNFRLETCSHYETLFRDDDIHNQQIHSDRMNATKECTIFSLKEVLTSILQQRKRILFAISSQKEENVNISWKIEKDRNEEILQTLLSILKTKLQEVPDLDIQEKNLVFNALMELVYKDISYPSFKNKREDKLEEKLDFSKKLSTQISSVNDWDKLMNSLEKSCQHTGLYLQNSPEELIRNVADAFFQNGIFLSSENIFQTSEFDKFIEKVLLDLQNLYLAVGTFDIDVDEIKKLLYSEALAEICEEDDEKIQNFILKIIDQNIADISEINTKLKDVGFSKEEIDGLLPKTKYYDQKLSNLEEKILKLEKEVLNVEEAIDLLDNIELGNINEESDEFVRIIKIISTLRDKIIEDEKLFSKKRYSEIQGEYLDISGFIFEEKCEIAKQNKIEYIKRLKNISIDQLQFNEYFDDNFLRNAYDDDYDVEDAIIDGYPSDESELLEMYEIVFGTNINPTDSSDYANENKGINYFFEDSVYKILNDKFTKGESFLAVMDSLVVLQSKINMKNRPGMHKKEEFFHHVLSKITLNNDVKNLQIIYQLSFHIGDLLFATRIQSVVVKKLIAEFSFDEMFEFIFSESWSGYVDSGVNIMEPLLEEKAITHSQIEQCKDKIINNIYSDRNLKNIGILANMETLGVEKGGKVGFLIDLLETNHNDANLKRRLFDEFHALKDVNNYANEETKYSLDDMVNRLYRLDEKGKYIILRKLLLGKDGILNKRSRIAKESVSSYFFSSYVETDRDDEIENVLKEMFQEFLQKGDVEHTYFILVNLLLDRILKLPKEESSWDEIIDEEMEDPDEYEEGYDKDVEREELRAFCYGSKTGARRNEIELNNRLFNCFEKEFLEKDIEKLSSTELILEVAKKMGAIGVRFLQVMGQYMDISKDLEKRKNDVYDDVNSQSKLTAHSTVKREWEEFDNEIVEMYGSIGGGSMTTVYKTKTASGDFRVLKVLNPSFQYRLETSYKMLEKLFSGLGEEHPERYKMALPILKDIETWIKQDMSFKGFLKQDKMFFKKWNDFRIKNNEYRIKIPQSFEPDSVRFKQEEFVEGKNLTDIAGLEADGHNVKNIVQLIIEHYLAQIKHGRVHSDVHIGNFRITRDRQVAVLDRNFYLDLNIKDKLFVQQVATNMNDPKKLATQINKYLSQDNKSLQQNPITNEMTDHLENMKDGDLTKNISNIMIFLRKKEIKIPLKITLLVKNLNALNNMAQTVGITF